MRGVLGLNLHTISYVAHNIITFWGCTYFLLDVVGLSFDSLVDRLCGWGGDPLICVTFVFQVVRSESSFNFDVFVAPLCIVYVEGRRCCLF